jgi:hypothetical protein
VRSLPPESEARLQELERATARLPDLNPADFATVDNALEERALAIERLMACLAGGQDPADHDPDLAARIEKVLATGALFAVRLTLVRAGVSGEIAGLGRGRRLLDALARARVRTTTSRGLDCNG